MRYTNTYDGTLVGVFTFTMATHNNTSDPRHRALYTPVDVARLARVNPDTLRRWTQPAGARLHGLILPAADDSRSPFSFMNLVEAYVLGFLRREHGLRTPDIRRAVTWLSRHYPEHRHPLATLALETDGFDLFVRENDLLISASESGQIVFRRIMDQYMSRIERGEDGLPRCLYPYMASVEGPRQIAIDPSVQFGRPVVARTRISTSILAERFAAGESVRALAADYEVAEEAVEEALRCETHLHGKAA